MKQIALTHSEELEQMAHQTTIEASEGHRAFGQLLKRVHDSDEHLIVELDGLPVAVMMSYEEYSQLRQPTTETAPPSDLPPVLSLEEAFGSVTPINRPEDFAALREAAIEEHVQQVSAREDGA